MSEMVERVVRAIAENMPSPYELDIVWRTTSDGAEFDFEEAKRHDRWEKVARAAIEAMREPTDAMCGAGSDAHGVWGFGSADARVVFPAMIDAALKE